PGYANQFAAIVRELLDCEAVSIFARHPDDSLYVIGRTKDDFVANDPPGSLVDMVWKTNDAFALWEEQRPLIGLRKPDQALGIVQGSTEAPQQQADTYYMGPMLEWRQENGF